MIAGASSVSDPRFHGSACTCTSCTQMYLSVLGSKDVHRRSQMTPRDILMDLFFIWCQYATPSVTGLQNSILQEVTPDQGNLRHV